MLNKFLSVFGKHTVVGFLKFAISVRRSHCDYWPSGPKI